MIIKVCGMRDADNIRALASLDIDMMGLIFYPRSPRYVSMISSRAGIIPDHADERIASQGNTAGNHRIKKVGVFVDDMPQSIITRVVNFGLDYVQLHGDESPTMIANLRASLIPDIVPSIKVIKALSIGCADDLRQAGIYDGVADMLLFDTRCRSVGGSGTKFDWDMLSLYKGHTPFLLSGGIGPDDAESILSISHPMMAGIDVNSKFESAPAVKDIELLRTFITKIRTHEQDKQTV